MDLQAMHGFVEWTYGVLSPREQTLLRRMSAFAGGATRKAVEHVCCGDDLAPEDVSAALTALVEQAIAGVEAADDIERYVLPASIRAYARERAKENGDYDFTAMRHACYFLECARALGESYSTRSWQPRLSEMVPELENLRAALIFTVTQGNDVQLGAELTAWLIEYWQHIGRMSAGREWIDLLLARGVDFPRSVRARLLYGLSRLDSARSKHALESALLSVQEYRILGDELGLAAALFEGAAAYSALGELDASHPLLGEALEIATRLGDIRRMGDVLNGMALDEGWRGNTLRARELFEQSLELFRRLEDDRGVASLLGNLGDLAAFAGDYERALNLSRQSLAIFERLHDSLSTAWQLTNIGSIELKRGNIEAARPALRRALELVRENQDDWLSANCVDSLSRLALAQREFDRAYRLALFADEIFASIGVPRQPPDQLDRERVVRDAACASRSAIGSGASLSRALDDLERRLTRRCSDVKRRAGHQGAGEGYV